MRVCIDQAVTFNQLDLAVGCWRRDSVERSAAGLDGVVVVDCGRRTRQIAQRGLMWAFSDQDMKRRIDEVRVLMDGAEHVLTIGDGASYGRLRIDGIEVGRSAYSGRGVTCEFEIRYRQMGQ